MVSTGLGPPARTRGAVEPLEYGIGDEVAVATRHDSKRTGSIAAASWAPGRPQPGLRRHGEQCLACEVP